MKILISLISAILLVSCLAEVSGKARGNIIGNLLPEATDSKYKEIEKSDSSRVFYVGTYTGNGSKGIYKYLLNQDGSLDSVGLAASTSNPSFLTKSADNKYLLAISEISNLDKTGFVKSYALKGNELKLISESTSGGAHPCFVTVNKSGDVLVANYTGGNVALLHMDSRGSLSKLLDLQQHTGSGPTDRQQGPHAHSAWFDPGNNNTIAVDLGTDELWITKLDKEKQKLIPAIPATIKMNPGSGPRHLVFHPNGKWLYVINELDCTVSLVEKTDNTSYMLKSSVSALPADYKGKNTSADIHISRDGKFVYASNRGHNSIVIFSVNETDGSLILIGFQSTKGNTPRNFSLSPDEKFLLVANQNTNNIVSFKRDPGTGLLDFVEEIYAPSPVCILFL